MQNIQLQPQAIPHLPIGSARVFGRAPFALVLTLLTGLTLGQLTPFVFGSFEKPADRSTAATRTGMAFYDAIDAYLTSGQTSELQALTHPDFVDHIDGRSPTSGVDALLDQLGTWRAYASESRLIATPLPSSGDLVRFAISIPPGAGASILGLPVAQTESSAYSDTLRIAEGQVAERWSNLEPPATMTLLASTEWDPPPAGQILPGINRITLLSGSKLTLKLGTAHVILVESGALTITGTARRAASSLPEFPVGTTDFASAERLVAFPGLAVVAAGNSPYHITNDGPAVARVLLIRIAAYAVFDDLPAYGSIGTSRNDVGVQIETLSAAVGLPNHDGAWSIDIGRATLAPGTTVPAHEVAGSELIVVEQGALDADLGHCVQRCIQTIEGAGALANEQSAVRTGQGISVGAGAGATSAYHVTGSTPATILIVTISPK